MAGKPSGIDPTLPASGGALASAETAPASSATALTGADPALAPTSDSARLPPAPMLAIGRRIGDRYAVRAFLGEGGMGAVYRALDESLGEEVALKVVRGGHATTARLRDEVRLSQRVTHPNVCRTYDLEEIDGLQLVKMELVEGETLAAVLRRDGKLPVARAIAIARGIAAGLAAAHARGIVHRDLKPGNVMLSGDRVVLMDFGLAQRAGESDLSGTPGYMAPEQLAGLDVSGASDSYALGCVAYELLTGERVFTGATLVELATRHATLPPPDVRAKRPDAPRWLARAIAAMLAKQPAPRARGMALLVAGPRPRRALVAAAAVGLIAVTGTWWLARAAPVWRPAITDLPSYTENADLPVFSPDGTAIAYVSDRGPDKTFRPYREALAGGNAEPIDVAPGQMIAGLRWTTGGWLYALMLDGHMYRQRGSAQPIDLGEGADVAECGSALAVAIATPNGGKIELVHADGSRELVAEVGGQEVLSEPSCSPAGDRIAYARGSPITDGIAHSAVYVAEHGGAARELVTGASYPVFAAGGRSVVVSAYRGGKTNLYERSVDGGELHRVTFGDGPDLAHDVSRDGAQIVFDVDSSVDVVFVGDSAGRRQLTQHREGMSTLTPLAGGKLLVAQRSRPEGLDVVVIQIADGSVRSLAAGRGPFPAHDGARVFFRGLDAPNRLYAVAIDGGAPQLIGELPAPIAGGADGPDGVHVVLDRGDQIEAWHIPPGGAPEREDARGLVLPAPRGGWRAIATGGTGDWSAALVPPDRPLAQPERTLHSAFRPRWLADGRLAYADGGRFRALDLATGATTDLVAAPPAHTPAVLADDGKHWFQCDTVGEVTRHLITRFAARPWAK